ncbi:hypothetical protein BJ165DRAFT_1460359 [Panaeolus papilionaceus]|nr:hypothetical protein BJ165DRAFT_1460359 [Panaeolus papilionaceus]
MSSATIDPSTTLCLACSASLPPNLYSKTSQTKLLLTNCCKRPICPSCIESNPRLARYDPCLMCLQGVDLVGAPSSRGLGALSPRNALTVGKNVNLDGAMRDEDAFVVDDEESEDEDEVEVPMQGGDVVPRVAPLSFAMVEIESKQESMQRNESEDTRVQVLQPFDMSSLNLPPTPSELDTFEAQERKSRLTPYKYYLNKSDTLQGLSLRFAVDAREICKLNSLPASAIRTTPHLLHTRAFLLLPASAKPHPLLELTKEEQARRDEQIVRERAERNLQTLTKEADWRVAKAYVAVASVQDEELSELKDKERGYSSVYGGGIGALALERYLDDEDWEARERRAGRSPSDTHGVPPSPFKAETASDFKSFEAATSKTNRGHWSFFRSRR